MKITFKDVGQGDSIIIEWEDEIAKIGIIDCNRKFGTNPVLEHVKTAGYKKIEFLILSHPHEDHFSGMVELLNYAEANNITIGSFGHTIHLLSNDYYKYLNGVEAGTTPKTDLEKLFNVVDKLRKNEVIKYIDFLVEGSVVDIKDNVYLKCLSPCISEAETYMHLVDLQPVKNKTKASQSANYLSTIFKLVVDDNYVLLTADSEVPTFERLIAQNRHVDLTRKQLKICQIPHHGALRNYHLPFWEYVTKNAKPDAVVSAGLHGTYKHPHLPVLMGFHGLGFNISCTNIVYGMVEYVDYYKSLSDITAKLDTFTDLISTHTGGDKTFPLIA